MKYILILSTFLLSTLYCVVLKAENPVDFPARAHLDELELAPLPGVNDYIIESAPLPTGLNDYLKLAPLPGIDESSENNIDDNDAEDENLTADSEPKGGYPESYSGDWISPADVENFKQKKLHFEKILKEIKDNKTSQNLLNKTDNETHLTPLELALDVLSEPNIIEWLIQSGAKLESSDLYIAIRAWKNVKLAIDKNKAKQIYFENIKLLLLKKTETVSALVAAIDVKQYDVINFLLDNRYVKPTQGDLTDATAKLNWETIQKFLEKGLDINGLSDDNREATPLMSAVEEERFDIVEKLLEAGADPNKKSHSTKYMPSDLRTPLEAAIFGSSDYKTYIDADLRTIRVLLKAGARPELSPKEWDKIRQSRNKSDKILIKIFNQYYAKGIFLSPTFWKIAKTEDVKEQIKNGEDVNKIGYKGWTPLMYASKYSRHPQEMVALLKENGATGFTSSWNFDLELTPENIQKQIDNGADPNTQKEEREYGTYGKLELLSPLFLAIKTNNVAAVKTLLENKVALNGSEPLFYALGTEEAWRDYGHPTNIEIVKLLLDEGINPNTTEKRTYHEMISYDYITSPLIMAVQKNELDLVKLLLKYGADPNQLVDDETPLMWAVKSYYPNLEIIKALLQSGANINKRNSKGRNAYFYVEEKNHHSSKDAIVAFLLENGIDVNNPKDLTLTDKEVFLLVILIIFVPTLITLPILRALKKGISRKNLLFVILCSLFYPVGFFFSLVGPSLPWIVFICPLLYPIGFLVISILLLFISIFLVKFSKPNSEIAFRNIRAYKIIRFLAILATILMLIYIGWSLYYAWTSSVIIV